MQCLCPVLRLFYFFPSRYSFHFIVVNANPDGSPFTSEALLKGGGFNKDGRDCLGILLPTGERRGSTFSDDAVSLLSEEVDSESKSLDLITSSSLRRGLDVGIKEQLRCRQLLC